MSDSIERAIFSEGQILGAADLTAAVEHDRGQQARHERYLHLWGIASGLQLTGKDKKTAQYGEPYQEITLSAGLAIDGTGRQVVVPADELLREDLFDQANVAVTEEQGKIPEYPVFLLGGDQAVSQPAIAAAGCGVGAATRLAEGYEILFGRPGDELDWEKQDTSAVTAGPGNRAWKVLLGFLQWDPKIKRFTAVSDAANGVKRRYAGVRADTLAARAGSLMLRSRVDIASGKPAVVLDETDGGLLRFGLLAASGDLIPVLTVTAKGDVKAEGAIQGAVTPGSVQIESGVATDGVTLPLPPGITEEQVANGQVTLHVKVSPRFLGGSPPNAATSDWVAFPLECRVDDGRRLLCRYRWFRPNHSGTVFQDLPGACDYLVLASVPASTGGVT